MSDKITMYHSVSMWLLIIFFVLLGISVLLFMRLHVYRTLQIWLHHKGFLKEHKIELDDTTADGDDIFVRAVGDESMLDTSERAVDLRGVSHAWADKDSELPDIVSDYRDGGQEDITDEELDDSGCDETVKVSYVGGKKYESQTEELRAVFNGCKKQSHHTDDGSSETTLLDDGTNETTVLDDGDSDTVQLNEENQETSLLYTEQPGGSLGRKRKTVPVDIIEEHFVVHSDQIL